MLFVIGQSDYFGFQWRIVLYTLEPAALLDGLSVTPITVAKCPFVIRLNPLQS